MQKEIMPLSELPNETGKIAPVWLQFRIYLRMTLNSFILFYCGVLRQRFIM